MQNYAFRPSAPLDRFVSTIWYSDAAAAPHAAERLLPDGSLSIIINLGTHDLLAGHSHIMRFPRTLLLGPTAAPIIIDTSQPACLIGVTFKPGMAQPFVAMPVDELTAHCLPLEEVWENGAADLHGRINAAETVFAKVRVLEAALLQRLAKSPAPRKTVAAALATLSRSAPPIHQLAADLGYTPRRLNQLFSAEVGLSPKRFQQVQRVQRVLQRLDSAENRSVATIAQAEGFYDQAHLTRHFRTCVGTTPAAYLKQKHRRTNHLPV